MIVHVIINCECVAMVLRWRSRIVSEVVPKCTEVNIPSRSAWRLRRCWVLVCMRSVQHFSYVNTLHMHISLTFRHKGIDGAVRRDTQVAYTAFDVWLLRLPHVAIRFGEVHESVFK